MRWQGRKQSSNVDDRRGRSTGKTARGFGIGSIIIVILGLLFGFDPSTLLGVAESVGGGGQATTQIQDLSPAEKQAGEFAAVVLQETENTWNKKFRENFGADYPEPTMVLFSGKTQSACGFASSATGPFYCPADQDIYLDLSFANTLRDRFGASGDFAMAYVIAHEVGHHIQHQLGYTRQVQEAKQRMSKTDANAMSVRLELMADYLAGVWAHDANRYAGILEEGDIREALQAASAIGDDAIQKRSQGYVVPDSFTHGTSEQRMKAFQAGYQTGNASKEVLDRFFTARDL